MRRLPVALLAALLASGCFALEEIDQGQQVMDQHYGKGRRDRAAAEASKSGKPAPAAEPKDEGVLARVRGWWDSKQAQGGGRSGAAPDSGPAPHPDDVLVRCQVGSTTQFMRKFDCQLRGGKVADV